MKLSVVRTDEDTDPHEFNVDCKYLDLTDNMGDNLVENSFNLCI